MRCVRFKHLHLLLYPRRLSTRHTSGMRSPKNSCTKSCTGSPKCLNPWLRATTSLSAVLHEVADCPEDFHARGNTLPDFGLTSSKCIPLTLRDVQASPFQSASVESSICRPVTSQLQRCLRFKICHQPHKRCIIRNGPPSDPCGQPSHRSRDIRPASQRCKESTRDVARALSLIHSRLVVGVSPLCLGQVGRRHWIQLCVQMVGAASSLNSMCLPISAQCRLSSSSVKSST